MLPVLYNSSNGLHHAHNSHWLSPAARTRGRGTLLIHVFGIASLCTLATSTTFMYFRQQRMGYSPLVESFPGQTSAVAALRLPTGTVERPPLASDSPAHHTGNLTAPIKGPSGSGLALSATSSQLMAQRHKHLDLIQQQAQQQQQQQQKQPQKGLPDAGQALLLPGFWGPGRIEDAATAVQAAVNPQLVQQAQQLLQILQTPPHLRPQAAAAQQLSAWMGRQARQPAATGSVKAQQQAPPAPPPAAAVAAATPAAAAAAAAGVADRKAAGISKSAVSNKTSSSAKSPPVNRQQAPRKAATSTHAAALGNRSSPTVAQHAVVAATPVADTSSSSSSSKMTSTSSGAPVTKQHPPVAHRFWADPFAGVAPWHTRPVTAEAPAPWSRQDKPEPPATVDDPVGAFRGDRTEPHPVVAA